MAVRIWPLTTWPVLTWPERIMPAPPVLCTEAVAIWPKPEGWLALATGKNVKLISRFIPINWLNVSIFVVFWICFFLAVLWGPRRFMEPVGTFMLDRPYVLHCCLIATASVLAPVLAVQLTFQAVMSAVMGCLVAVLRRTDSEFPHLLETQMKELAERVEVEWEKRREMWGVKEDGKVVYGRWWLENEDKEQEEV